jgi:hypothetical protein
MGTICIIQIENILRILYENKYGKKGVEKILK